MSRATRQEALIRSLIEALCLALQKKLADQPRQKQKVEAVSAILEWLETLSRLYPVLLEMKEAAKVLHLLDWFRETQNADSDLHLPEVLISMALGLAAKLEETLRLPRRVPDRYGFIAYLTQRLQALYDTFDRQGKKLALLTKGAEFCDQILAQPL